jgi:hypothetical protein
MSFGSKKAFERFFGGLLIMVGADIEKTLLLANQQTCIFEIGARLQEPPGD